MNKLRKLGDAIVFLVQLYYKYNNIVFLHVG